MGPSIKTKNKVVDASSSSNGVAEVTSKSLGNPNRKIISLYGKLYDITDFIAVHPGGVSPISLGLYQDDATSLFEANHPSHLKQILDSRFKPLSGEEEAMYRRSPAGYIKLPSGRHDLVSTKIPTGEYEPKDDSFYKEVKKEVEIWLKQNNYKRRHNLWAAIECLGTFVVFLCLYWYWVHGGAYSNFMMGVLFSRFGFLMHMGNHCAFFTSPFLNNLASWYMELMGASTYMWLYDHNIRHHAHTNDIQLDPDTTVGDPTFRLNPNLKQRWIHRFQYVYVWLVMSTGSLKWAFQDIGLLMFHMNDVTFMDQLRFWTAKAGLVGLYVLMPWYVQQISIWEVLGNLLVTMAVLSYFLYAIFVVSHCQPDTTPDLKEHWAVQQVKTTVNWSSTSIPANLYSGGLNHQIEHHLFPSLSHYYYPYISPIVQRVCAKYGIPYRNEPSFFHAWYSCAKFLYTLGH